MTDQSSISGNLKQFLTEEQIEVERQRRQADWERVRSANDPIGTGIFFLGFVRIQSIFAFCRSAS